MGSGYAKKKKQARELQEKMEKMQEDMEKLEVLGSAGNGLVTVTLSGEGELKNIVIQPECVDPEDVEGLQDLILAAFKEGRKKLQEQSPNDSLLSQLSLENLPFNL